MNRREFLAWVGVGGVASFLPVAIAACSSQDSNSSTSSNLSPTPSVSADGFQSVGTVATLEQTGQISLPQFAGHPLVVVRNPADPQQLVAVDPTCTHKGCPASWQADQQKFICHCHNSQFGIDGKVLQGPAREPLKTYTAKIEKDTILVKAVS